VENEPIKIDGGVNTFFKYFCAIAKIGVLRGEIDRRTLYFPARREKSFTIFARATPTSP
jgi:hypothetical protein